MVEMISLKAAVGVENMQDKPPQALQPGAQEQREEIADIKCRLAEREGIECVAVAESDLQHQRARAGARRTLHVRAQANRSLPGYGSSIEIISRSTPSQGAS
jgi:hypothetical protein